MKIVHYASYLDKRTGEEIFGTAELVNGSGYLFRKEGERKGILVSYTDGNLVRNGLVEMADRQWATDRRTGHLARLLGKSA